MDGDDAKGTTELGKLWTENPPTICKDLRNSSQVIHPFIRLICYLRKHYCLDDLITRFAE